MAKWLIVYDYGYGEMSEVVECDTHAEAEQAAYEAWREGAENAANYFAEPLARENAENYGHEDEYEDDEDEGTLYDEE